MVCISTELANLIYGNVEINQVPRTDATQEELCGPETKEQ